MKLFDGNLPSSRAKLGSAVAIACLAALALSGRTLAQAAAPTDAVAGGSATAISAPSERRVLNFLVPGLVVDVPVKEGDIVKKDQLLVVLDEEADKAELDRLTIAANSTARLEYARATFDVKKKVLERKTEILKNNGMNQSEVEDAQLEATQAEKSIKVSEDDILDAKFKATIQAKKLKDMRKLSPMDGVVQKINVGAGESSETRNIQGKEDGAIIIVKNDPLDIELKELSTAQVAKLQVGQKMQVRYADDGPQAEWREASIANFSPVADAGSDTRAVKLKLPNPENRPAGLRLQVKLPQELIAAADPLTAAGK